MSQFLLFSHRSAAVSHTAGTDKLKPTVPPTRQPILYLFFLSQPAILLVAKAGQLFFICTSVNATVLNLVAGTITRLFVSADMACDIRHSGFPYSVKVSTTSLFPMIKRMCRTSELDKPPFRHRFAGCAFPNAFPPAAWGHFHKATLPMTLTQRSLISLSVFPAVRFSAVSLFPTKRFDFQLVPWSFLYIPFWGQHSVLLDAYTISTERRDSRREI